MAAFSVGFKGQIEALQVLPFMDFRDLWDFACNDIDEEERLELIIRSGGVEVRNNYQGSNNYLSWKWFLVRYPSGHYQGYSPKQFKEAFEVGE